MNDQKAMLKARVSEIIADYLMDDEEAYAECTLRFLKMNGETQEKTLRWIHPDLDQQIPKGMVSMADLMKMTSAELSASESYYWNKANEVITERNTRKGI